MSNEKETKVSALDAAAVDLMRKARIVDERRKDADRACDLDDADEGVEVHEAGVIASAVHKQLNRAVEGEEHPCDVSVARAAFLHR